MHREIEDESSGGQVRRSLPVMVFNAAADLAMIAWIIPCAAFGAIWYRGRVRGER